MPQALLLDALSIRLEVLHQVLDLLNLGIGVGVHDLGKILHQAEVSAHGVSQTSQLTELWDERDLIACSAILVDEQRLVHVANVLIVAGLVVLLVASGSPVLVEGGCWTLREIDPINLVGLLVVSRHHGSSRQSVLDRLLAVLPTLLSLVSQIIHVVQTVICPDHLEADVNVEKDA